MQTERFAWCMVMALSCSPVALFAQGASTKADALAHMHPKTFNASFSVPSKATPEKLDEYRDQVAALLATAFAKDRKASDEIDLKAAQRLCKKAHSILSDDPRADFALALVQLKAGEDQEAIKTLDKVGKGDGYAPAFEARTLQLLYRSNYKCGG